MHWHAHCTFVNTSPDTRWGSSIWWHRLRSRWWWSNSLRTAALKHRPLTATQGILHGKIRFSAWMFSICLTDLNKLLQLYRNTILLGNILDHRSCRCSARSFELHSRNWRGKLSRCTWRGEVQDTRSTRHCRQTRTCTNWTLPSACTASECPSRIRETSS